jgi:hypothetical protein
MMFAAVDQRGSTVWLLNAERVDLGFAAIHTQAEERHSAYTGDSYVDQ